MKISKEETIIPSNNVLHIVIPTCFNISFIKVKLAYVFSISIVIESKYINIIKSCQFSISKIIF